MDCIASGEERVLIQGKKKKDSTIKNAALACVMTQGAHQTVGLTLRLPVRAFLLLDDD